MRHLVAIARDAGLEELVAEVLPGNMPMRKVFENSGLPCKMKREGAVVHFVLGRAFSLSQVMARFAPTMRNALAQP